MSRISAAVTTTHAQKRPARAGVLLVRAVITVAVLGVLAAKLDLPRVAAEVARTDVVWLAVAATIIAGSLCVSAMRWNVLLRTQDVCVSPHRTLQVGFIGQFFNTFLFGATGGDVVRALYARTWAPGRDAGTLLSILVDRCIGLFCYLSFAVISLPLQLRAETADASRLTHAFIGAWSVLAASAAAAAFMPVERLPGAGWVLTRSGRAGTVLTSVLSACRLFGRQWRLTAAAVCLGGAVCTLISLSGLCLARSMGIGMTFGQAAAVVCTVVCILALPVSVGGHGLREAGFILAFRLYGIDAPPESAVVMSLLYFLASSVSSLIGGCLYLAVPVQADERDPSAQE